MEKFVLRTKLAEDPHVALYYKGMAHIENVSFALNRSSQKWEFPFFIITSRKLLKNVNRLFATYI